MTLIVFALMSWAFAGAVGQMGAPAPRPQTTQADTFKNPLLPTGPDPWVIYRDGYYYYMNTTQKNLTIWKTRDITDLRGAEKKIVWTAPAEGPYSHDVWAPELHYISGIWYIYFAADSGTNKTHRLWVLQHKGPDPLTGKWILKGKVSDPTDKWAIDPTVFKDGRQLYLVWSGWESDDNGVQNIYIARLRNPWTVEGRRLRISTPEYPWEKVGDKNPLGKVAFLPHIDVNEGPEVLQHGGKIFVIYSGSACWTDYYELGMLTASAGSNLLDTASWEKSAKPVFWQSPKASVYATGHNSFFKSPDGKEDWILYHANSRPNQGCGATRSPRAQPFTWNVDGTPDFGRPLPTDQPIKKPSGQVR
jgi:GH43 family beta-xylosidase